MRILLVAATVFEIRPFLDKLTPAGIQNANLSRYQLHDHHIDVLIPGVGMVPTAYYTGLQLAKEHYDLAINAGIAGTYQKSLSLGSVVNVVEDCVPELGAENGEQFISVFELGLTDPDCPPYKGGKLVNDFQNDPMLNNNLTVGKLPKARAITSNTVHGNAESIAQIRKNENPDVESMEGAAFFFACFSEQLPCLQIRSISNFVEERDKSRWNLELALKNLNRMLYAILSSFRETD